MDIASFIDKFGQSLNELPQQALAADTRFRELNQWTSMQALITIAMIDDEYGVTISGEDMKQMQTLEELYKAVNSRQPAQ